MTFIFGEKNGESVT